VTGVFSHQGNRLMLLINRPVKKVELYEGKRKLIEFKGGLKFEVTNPIATVKGKIVKVRYHDLQGNVSSQQLTIPDSFVKAQQAGRRIKKVPASRLSTPVSGNLQRQGDRLTLQLNRRISKVTLYDGKRKIGELSGGPTIDITSLMTGVKGRQVRVEYHDMKGRVSSQILTIPAASLSEKSRLPDKSMESLKPTGPTAVLQNYPPHHGGLDVIIPAANDFISAGQQHDIVWDVHGYLTVDCTHVILYRDGNQVEVIDYNINSRVTPGQDGIHWNVPTHLAGLYTVEVKTCDNEASDMSDSFLIISPEPDLSIQNLNITPATPTSNDTIRVRAAVTNMGNTVADSSRAVLTVRDPDGVENTFTIHIPTLGFGAHTYIEKEYKVNRGGTYENTLNVEVVLSTALETHLDDNEASTNVTINGLPDLVVCFDAIMTGEVWHYQDIYGYVKNIGDGQAGPTTVNVWVEGKGTSTYSVPILVSTQSEYVNGSNLLWTLDGNREFYFDVDPGDAITERHEDNNRRDGIIKIHGCTLAEMAVGLCNPPNDPDWYGCSGSIPVYNQPYTVVEVN